MNTSVERADVLAVDVARTSDALCVALSDGGEATLVRIRHDQMNALQSVVEAGFVKRLATTVRDRHGGILVQDRITVTTVEQIPDDTLHEMVRQGVARARAYGISHESALAAFVLIMFESAPNFDTDPLIAGILRDADTDANKRVDRVLDQATEQTWQAVRANYDRSSWGVSFTASVESAMAAEFAPNQRNPATP